MTHSKRKAILARVSEYISSGDWEDRRDYLVFGKEAFQIAVGEVVEEADEHQDFLRKSIAKIKVDQGSQILKKRLSLEPISDRSLDNAARDLTSDYLDRLPQEVCEELIRLPPHGAGKGESFQAQGDDADFLDAALASQELQQMDSAHVRVSGLDEMDVNRESIRNPEYFEEAHRCNHYGLNIAAAVLCRAMLETALKQVVDPKRMIASRLRSEKSKESYIDVMIDNAQLDAGRKCAAKKIKKAGNDAIHELPQFRKLYADQIPELIDKLRIVLIDLYGSLESRSRLTS